jgi:putative chitinase
MITLTEKQLKSIMPKVSPKYVPFLNKWMEHYGITTIERVRHFLAQIAHESCELTAVIENLNYSDSALLKVFPKYFDAKKAKECQRNPEKIANIVYANRMGNTEPGDGWKYRGRGAIMITGKANYAAISKDWKEDLVKNPELLEDPSNVIRSACWFWWKMGLNGKSDIKLITKIINGGYNGLEDRKRYYEKACKVIV